MYIKTGSSTWKNTAQLYIKTTASVWERIRQGYIKTASSTWKRFFYEANLPVQSVGPTIRTTNTGSGTIYDGPVATSPRYINEDLFGKDGSYTNYTSIYGRKFTYASTVDSTNRTIIVNDDRFTSAGGVTTSDRLNVDDKYLFYELTVSNGGDDQIFPVSNPIKMIKQAPYSTSFTVSGSTQIGETLTANINVEYYYYNRPELGSSYVNWYVGSYAGDTSNLVRQTSLSSALTSTTSSQYLGSDTFYVDPSYSGQYITLRLVAESSWTRHNGFATSSYGLDFAYAGGGSPVSGALSITNFRVEDYNGNNGLDSRYDFPVASNEAIKATINGVDSNTTYRIRYRVYNWQTGAYHNITTGATGTASGVWTTYTADGTGSGDISSVIITGSTAELTDYITVDSAYFDGSTYSGGQYRWQIEIELSAIKTGGTRVYWINPYASYYLTRAINSTISVSPATISPGSSTTMSGAFSGYPAGTAYPRQYKIDYGDGSDSGWLPVGEYGYGTANPTYSISHTYSTAGTYYPTIETIPYYTTNAATVTVASVKTAPTITSVTSGIEGGPVTVYFTGGSGPYYQIYWTSGTAPTVPVTPDGSGFSSPITDATGPASTGITWYMYIRSVETSAETSVGPSTLASAWSSGYSFTVASSAVTQNSAPTARATNTFSTSTVKYLDSITWSSGTYNNASSITSVLLYSTNTANLVSPNGNTNTIYRTANPYSISTADPTGTPYVFAVRDTVVGTNGTTYYFYSNQITSALADGVSFSYGTATSTSGGWTASINSGTQTGATYSYVSATVGSGSVNSSTGAVTASGLSSGQSSTITVRKSVSGYSSIDTTASGSASTVVTYTLTYSANGGSTTPSSQTGANGDTITLAANAGTRSGYSFGGWNIGGVTYSGGGSYTFGSANATATAIWTAVFVTPVWNGTMPGWTSGSNFQRITTSPANYKWGWTNGTFSFSGSTSGTRGWNWEVRQSASASGTHQSGSPGYYGYTTSNDTYTTVQGVYRPYLISSARGDVTYSTSSRYGRVQPYVFGTDGNEYQGPWTGFI